MVVLGKWLKEITDIDHVASNFDVEYADYYLDNPKEMDELTSEKPVIVLLDEVWAWWDSRKAMSNDDMSDIVMNSRKRGCIILYTVQYLNMADVRLRQLTDYLIVPQHYESYDIGLEHDLLILNVFETDDLERIRRFEINAEPFYGVYNTTEEVTGTNEAEEYEKYIEKAKEMFLEGDVEYKKEVISYFTTKEGLKPTLAERLVDTAYLDVKNEVED